jgi:hypothetical protein
MEGQPAKKARIESSFNNITIKDNLEMIPISSAPLLCAPIIIAIPTPFKRGNKYPRLMSVVISGQQSLAPIQEHPDEGRLARPKSC